MPRGRPRSTKNIPAHIKDATKLPKKVWYSNKGAGCWMLHYFDAELDKLRAKRLCGSDASMSEIWQAYDALQTQTETTFKSLSLDFQKSHQWRALSILTQEDYIGCHNHICSQKTGSGPFGDIPVVKITTGTIRKYRDFRGESSKSRANKELAYLSRVFSWAYEYEKCKHNPAKGVSKLKIPPRQHYAEDKDFEFLLQVAKESGYWYMCYAMEIAYLCRMRLSEVIDLTNADEQPTGLYIRRRKGSKNNITAWTPRLEKAWKEAKSKRDQIIVDKRLPAQLDPKRSYLFISERTGDKITVSSLKTAKGRIDTQAKQKAIDLGIDYTHFTFHDLKRKGISDTAGNKQDASGHRHASMLAIYDVKPIIVKPAGEK